MQSNNLSSLTIKELSQLLLEKKVSVLEVTEHFLNQAESRNTNTNAYITITREEARKQAQSAQDKINNDQAELLTGIPFCMKDAYVTEGIVTTCASKVLDNYVPAYSATVYTKLRQQGAILVGKNNQDAWGHGGSSQNSDYGPVRNPWNLERTAGGSSGGTAAALASGTATFGIGEDTGGSIRNPASFNNICGLKVTYGRVSRYGAIAYASSLDTVGPMAKTVSDLAIVLEAIAGFDPKDASSSRQMVPDYSNQLDQPLTGRKIGVVKEYFGQGLDPEVKQILQKALQQLEALGVEIIDVSLPTLEYGVSIYYVIALSETSSNLARYDGIRYGHPRELFSAETKRRIFTGTFSLSSGYYDAYYKMALKARTKLIREFEQAFSVVDALIAPVMPFPAYKLGEAPIGDDAVLANYLADLYTCATNPVGIPSLAIPAGFTTTQLPVGMQLMGPMFSENVLMQLGYNYQQSTNWHKRTPDLDSNMDSQNLKSI